MSPSRLHNDSLLMDAHDASTNIDNNHNGDTASSTCSVSDFEIEEQRIHPINTSSKVVTFENEIVILENNDIFENNKLKFQVFSAMMSLFFIGLTDQVIGSLLEYTLDYYKVDRVQVSYLFVLQFCGYFPASLLNNYLMDKFGLHKLYYTACLIVCVTTTLFFCKIPFFFLPICSIFIGWSCGVYDCCLHYFVGNLKYSNEILGLMHAMYGFGCLITPVLSQFLINLGLPWNYYYLVLLMNTTTNFILAYFFFRNETSAKFRFISFKEREKDNFDSPPTVVETITHKYVVFYAVILFIYAGSGLSVGVWLDNYLFKIKKIPQMNSSLITSFYWFSMTIGRATMGFYTGRYFENREIKAILRYSSIVTVSCLFFWICQFSTKLQSLSIFIAAWFFGPIFGTTVVISLKTLPKRYALHSISLIAGFGGAGTAIIPSIIGYVSEHYGVDQASTPPSTGQGLKYFPLVTFLTFLFAGLLWIGFYLCKKNIFDSKIRLE